MIRSRHLMLFFLCFTVVFICVRHIFFSCPRLSCLTLNNLSLFKLKEVYKENKDVFRAFLTHEKDILRVEVRSHVNQPEDSQLINAQIANVKALFALAASPYPGEISDEIDCQEKFKPAFAKIKNQTGIIISYFIGYLNQRLVFGSCIEDQMFYKGILALFYCPKQKQLFQIEIIAPKKIFEDSFKEYQNMLKSLGCSKSN